jgi:hypothetical protein
MHPEGNPQISTVRIPRRSVSIAIVLLVAAIHVLRIGRFLGAGAAAAYASYFSDIAIPFAFYFLLCAAEVRVPFLQGRVLKIAFTFVLPAFAECCQYFGLPMLGSTFDPIDFSMYACGAVFAAVIEFLVFHRLSRPASDASNFRPTSR